MTDPATYRQCLDAGMTAREAADAMGKSRWHAYEWARRNGVRFTPAPRPGCTTEAVRAALSVAQKRRFSDPREVARMSAARSLAAKVRRALAEAPEKVRADYKALRSARYSIPEALRAIGRAELIRHGVPECL